MLNQRSQIGDVDLILAVDIGFIKRRQRLKRDIQVINQQGEVNDIDKVIEIAVDISASPSATTPGDISRAVDIGLRLGVN
jgi:hypothetical protein